MAQWLTNPTRNHDVAVPSLALLSGLKIQRCRELWCRLQTQLGSRVAMALAWNGGYSSDSTPSLGSSICHRSSPKKWQKDKKKIEIISSIFLNHNVKRLGINYKKKNCKEHKHVEAKQYTTKWITEEIKKKYLETNESESTMIQNLWDRVKAVLREVSSDRNPHQETRKISNKQPNLTSKGTRKRKTNQTQN